jgi:HEPN domain-containing protein
MAAGRSRLVAVAPDVTYPRRWLLVYALRCSMATSQQLKDLALLRLREADALFEAGLYDGAKYLSGYVVELALKARICGLLDLDEYPEKGELKRVYAVHDLDQLLVLAGLRKAVDPTKKPLFDNWSTAALWKPEGRYDAAGTVTRQDAEDILNAIRDGTNGVLTWIKALW